MMEDSFPMTWDQKINLIGKKIDNPRIHLCEKCNFPIVIYGRMIPCKHVFCFDCAKTTEKTCLRCGDSVSRIEQSLQGQIFMCEYGAAKHSHLGCRRTYLSQRDLQAHVNHRHKKQPQKSHDHSKSSSKDRRPSDPRTEPRGERAEPKRERSEGRPDPRLESRPDPRLESRTSTYQQVQNYSVGSTVSVEASSADYGLAQPIVGQTTGTQGEYHIEHVPVRNTNLITVPLHDSGGEYQASVPYANPSAPPPPVPYSAPNMVPPEHQTSHNVRPPIPYQVPHVTPIMTTQPGGYNSATATIPPPPVPQAVPYNIAPQAVPPNPVIHYEQPPPQASSYPPPGGHSSATYSSPVSAAWTAPNQSHPVPGAIPAPEGNTPTQSHSVLPDSTTYPGSYY